MNRVALVTGASRGIGRAIAAELAEAGHAVCINYLTHRQEAETLAEKIRNHGGNAIAVQADVADRAAVETMVRTAEAELGPVSLLVNNAGIAGQIQFQDITDAQWNRYLGVNLGGARNTIQAVLPHMLHEKAGCIVNISSIWGLRGASCEVAYACTKAALVGLTRSLALELAPSHIRVNCVAPGVIDTEMNGQLSELNRSLNEANVVKEKYIGYFMNRCALYINKLCAYRKDVSHKLRSGQIDRLKIPPKEQDREFDELYAEFDEAFLKLYPSFVEEFNELLRPEARYETTEGRLNTELRIFALMRLGLTNVNQIAEFLRCSLQTVYNYKSKIKSKAQPGIEHFEEEVRKLGQNTFASDSM